MRRGKTQNKQSASLCQGDSGGGVFLKYIDSVAGVNSQHLFIDDSGISFVNTHTRVSEVYDWLIQVLPQVNER